jgi:hypothetical protein
MKIRLGFVSNSSSSSFVTVDARTGYDKLYVDDNTLTVGQIGITEFGWGYEEINDMWSRINFAWLQTTYNPYFMPMFETVIKENSDITKILSVISKKWDEPNTVHGYIDHQSNASEGENTEIFDSKEILRDFIFGSHSKITLDNDNH